MPSLYHRVLHSCTWKIRNFVNLAPERIPQLRPRLDILGKLLRPPFDVHHRKLQIGDLPVEWLLPPKASTQTALLYLHGGGFGVGSSQTHRGLAGKLAKTSGFKTLIIDYRLAPEHPFPAALEDAMLAYQWLLDQEYQIVLAGDSAGGGLAISLQVLLKKLQRPLPLGCVCFSPWVDLSFSGESATKQQTKDPIVDARVVKDWGYLYAGNESILHPLVSPLYADLSGLSPTLIHASDCEVLTDDAIRLDQKLKMCGSPVTLQLFDGVQHVWQLFWFIVPEAEASLEEAGQFLRAAIQQEAYSSSTDQLKKSA